MKRMPFIRPTEHYDQRIVDLDEHICALIKQRKEISDNNPGFPPFEYIAEWANTYDLYEDFLKMVFGTFLSDEHYKPMVEPIGFRKHIAVMQYLEKDDLFYTLTSVRQYSNASVVTLNIDWDMNTEMNPPFKHSFIELYIAEGYDCRMINGGSSTGQAAYNYVISPPLDDDLSGVVLEFKEFSKPFKNNETGNAIVFRLE